jgi:hypothetical protein
MPKERIMGGWQRCLLLPWVEITVVLFRATADDY